MKKYVVKLMLLVVVLFSISLAGSAQIYVRVRPPAPVIVRPPQPSPVHVWIDEEWEPNQGKYKYAGGHWATPPHPGYVRRPGHWKRHRNQETWVQGGWERSHH